MKYDTLTAAPDALIQLPVHARTGLRALGVLPSGRIVWPQMGGAGDDDPPGGDAGTGNDDDGNDGDGDGDNDAGDGGDSGQGDPAGQRDQRTGQDSKTTRTIAALREDFKGERSKRQAAERKAQDAEKQVTAFQKQLDDMANAQKAQADGLAKLLGLKKDDGPPNPEQLAKELNDKLTAAQADADAASAKAEKSRADQQFAEVKLAVYDTASNHEADPAALLDSASFLRKVTGLDPEADDFAAQIGDAIKTAVEANGRLRKDQPKKTADRSGGEFNTGQPTKRKRASSLSEAVDRNYHKP